jgi:carnitine O-acetyltransferase
MLTYIMSPVRTLPSIDQQLVQASQRKDSVAMPPERSEANAKEATAQFSKEEKSPLASNSDSTSKPGITFAAQDKLPKLPIPDLESTCRKYLASLDPLQTAREHHDSERAIEEFLKTDGPGLQEKLKNYAEGKTSYIEQFCRFAIFPSKSQANQQRVRFIS